MLWTHGWRYFGGVFGVMGGFEMRELMRFALHAIATHASQNEAQNREQHA